MATVPDEWEQRSIYDELGGAPEPHARFTDPVSSELTLQSLGRDRSYNWRIFDAIMHLSVREEPRHYADGDSIAVIHDVPVTDDDIVDWLERRHGGRVQRNVIARQRGIVRELGFIQRVADIIGRTGRQTIAHIPTSHGAQLWHAHVNEGAST